MITDPIQVDKVSGQATTGHEWDGIRELNTPLPRWWLWTFYACIAFAFVYWIFYPSWPLASSFVPGVLGQTNRAAVLADVAFSNQVRKDMTADLQKASLQQIADNPRMLELALAEGKAAFANNCTPCHGAGGQGQKGYPNLTAGRWLWGGHLDQIQATLTHGIRWSDDPDTRTSMMPAFGKDGILKADQIQQVANYVRSLAGAPPEQGVDVAAGKAIFAENCVACHGEDGKGNLDMGAPNLTTKVWLYGNDIKDLTYTITNARNSVMPAWNKRLDPETIKSLAVYVHSLGGGQ